MFTREKTRAVKIGKVTIGAGNLVRVQSMTQTRTHDVKATVKQILELEEAGCEIIRVTVPDMESAKAIKSIKKQINIPLVVDIHFQYLLAIEAAKQGVDKVRINPVNMGSLEKDLYAKYGGFGVPRVMIESATRHIKILESLKFHNIVVSLKGDNAVFAKEAYMLFARRFDYPLHVGITEAGTLWAGSIKSAVG